MTCFKTFFLKIGLPLILFTTGSDRLSKAYIIDYLRSVPEKTVQITSFFNITQVWNYGVSFGLFQANSLMGVVLLIITGGLITGFLSYMLVKSKTTLEAIALCLIIGGALGNIFDRLYYGAVYDFLDFHLMNIHFWTFNPADVYISCGAILIFLDQIMIMLNAQNKTKI